MKPRYIKAPMGAEVFLVDGERYLPRTVHEPDRRPIDTGLLDRDGNRIWRDDPAPKVGFVVFGDKE